MSVDDGCLQEILKLFLYFQLLCYHFITAVISDISGHDIWARKV